MKPTREPFDAASLDRHKQLLIAFPTGDKDAVRSLMHEHHMTAQRRSNVGATVLMAFI